MADFLFQSNGQLAFVKMYNFLQVMVLLKNACVCEFGFNGAFNNFSVISRRCLVATRRSMLTFIVLPH